MNVEGILKDKGHEVQTVGPDTAVVLAVDRLSTMQIGALVVSADGSKVDGVISEREVVRGLARHGPRLLDLKVADVMTPHVPVCSPEDPIKDVMAQMTRTRNRHIPVVQGAQLYGLVSIGDLLKHRLEELELQTNVLRDPYITRH
ncbi:MAG: CBS domain-containing protein [Actinomycetota bacterium]|nr:CBS domain-containing protein [Actinomycetota bacterium]MDQ3575827.1 CBS domain-containing protein [Actinomycetota bacterium]